MAAGKRRLDQLLVERGLAESRSKAQALILAGLVFADELRLDKAGMELPVDAAVTVRGAEHPWVGRGGVKLAHALAHFAIDPTGRTCLDVGASTGGFTDVLLTRGAARVYAVDVGHGQLAWKLRRDARVVVLERTNARALGPKLVPEPIDLIVADVSFISLTVALPAALSLGRRGAVLVALVKPQFDVGKGQVGKGGIVRDPGLHEAACARVRAFLVEAGWTVRGIIPSPITGADGNQEFLIVADLA
ncbi:MAG: TlyA family RNA methyltransferase [Alphaproteobacteria bacterium]|nr:TlyA family RNA methyltransferase [Alphaproteobacteria bacterium]